VRRAGAGRLAVSDATRLVDDVMRLPIHKRAELYAESKSVRTTIAKATGTPWFIWIDSPVSFVENVLGEATWAGQRAILAVVLGPRPDRGRRLPRAW
jgi:hypothetical protein